MIENIGEQLKKECQLWYSLVFMIRSCILPNEEFEHVNVASIFSACELYYNIFFELYGQLNCNYYLHVVPSHLTKIRGDVPLTERSAFPFESFYSEMKNLYKSGTTATLKQILKNTIMKRKLEHHVCSKTIFYQTENKDSPLENNSSIYTFKNNQHELYVITEINGNELICKRQGKFKFSTPLMPRYDWKSIGVFRKGPIGTQTFTINKSDVKGKFMIVQNVLVTAPNNVLNEK